MNVVITGSSRGIGKSVAEKFALKGNHLFLCARNTKTLEDTVRIIKADHPEVEISYMAADLSVKADVINFAEFCLSKSVPDILINNAGVYLPGNIKDEPDGQFELMMNTNIFSAYYITRKLLPSMLRNGSGHIFNICSVASLHAYTGGGSYSISKFALDGFNTNLRQELKSSGIKVTAVYPGAVMTDSWGDFDNSDKRIMEANDVAEMIFASTRLSVQAVVEEIIIRPQLGDL